MNGVTFWNRASSGISSVNQVSVRQIISILFSQLRPFAKLTLLFNSIKHLTFKVITCKTGLASQSESEVLNIHPYFINSLLQSEISSS